MRKRMLPILMLLALLATTGCAAPLPAPSTTASSALPTSSLILGPVDSMDAAQDAALNFSGLPKAFTAFSEAEAEEKKDSDTVYKLEYVTLTAVYRMQLRASDGRILEYDVDGSPQLAGHNDETAAISTLTHMVPGLTVDGSEMEFDHNNDDGIQVYEGIVNVNGDAYKYEISAAGGILLQWTKK